MENASATLVLQGRKIPCRANIPIRKAMMDHDLSPSAFLILRDTQMVTDDEIVKPGEHIELISVISGG